MAFQCSQAEPTISIEGRYPWPFSTCPGYLVGADGTLTDPGGSTAWDDHEYGWEFSLGRDATGRTVAIRMTAGSYEETHWWSEEHQKFREEAPPIEGLTWASVYRPQRPDPPR